LTVYRLIRSIVDEFGAIEEKMLERNVGMPSFEP
jgi:hypothetical protein